MKKILILLYAAIIANQLTIAQVAINTDGTTPNTSAMLDIKSTSKGLLTPRMTTAQRNAIVSPATGLMVYDTDVNKFFFYAVGSWIEMGTGSATNYWTLNGSNINNNNAGNVGIGTATPQAPLHINNPAAAELLRLQGTNPYVSFYNAAGTYKGFLWQGPDDNVSLGTAIGNTLGAIRFETNGSLNMVVHPFGNVGIGTGFVPPHKLTVQTTTSNHGLAHTDGSVTVSSYVDNSGGWLGTYSNHPLHFFTNNGNQQMTLLQNGNFGIGTTNPLAKLHVNKDAEALRVSGSGSYISFYNGTSYRGYLWSKEPDNIELATAVGNTTGSLSLGVQGNPHLTVQSDGRVKVGALGCDISVGNFVPRLPKLSVQGPLGFKKSYADQVGEWTIYYYSDALENNYLTFYFNGGRKAWIDDADGDWNSVSDIRLKEDFEKYKFVLSGIKKLDVLTYHYKADKTGSRSFGLVAQNLKQYFPELVSGDEKNGYLAIAYGKTGVLALKAIQEQQVIIEEQQKRIETLEKRLAAIESKLR